MVCANDGPTISVAAGVGLVMVTLRSAVRCNVVRIALLLFPGTGSMIVAEPIVAESCLVLSCAALAANAALGKLPVMINVPLPPAPAVSVTAGQPVEVHPAAERLPEPTAPDGTNPDGMELLITALV